MTVPLALGAGIPQRTLEVLVVGSAALFALAVVLGVSAVFVRVARTRRERAVARLEGGWESSVLDRIVTGDAVGDPDPVARRDELPYVRHLVRLALRLRGAERERLGALAAPMLPRVAARARRGDEETRARALHTLSVLGMPRYASEIARALDDRSPLVSMVAARALARPEHAAHSRAVMSHVDRFEGWSSYYLASLLAGIGPAAATPLRAALANPARHEWVRVAAADALATINDPEAAAVAAEVIDQPRDATALMPDLICACLRVLARVGRAEHAPAVRALLADGDPAVRVHAVSALAELGEGDDADRLCAALHDTSPWVALRAAEGLRRLRRPDLLRLAPGREALAREVLGEGEGEAA